MKQLSDGLFEVPSDSDYSRTYIVNMTGPYPQCTCTHWAIQRNRAVGNGLTPPPCKHIKAVQRTNPAAMQAQRDAEAKARAEADAKAKAAEDAKREKMRAELLKMRADLSGEETPPPVKEASEPKRQTPAKKTPKPETAVPAGDDLLATLEAQIAARKGK